MASKFDVFPPCCQKILVALEREKRQGSRNCELGHLVSLDYAEVMRAQLSAKKSQAPSPSH